MDSQQDPREADQKPLISQLNPRFLLWLSFFIGGALLLAWAWQSEWPTPIIADDIHQLRANVTLPTPGDRSQIRQTFRSNRDGFIEIEVLAARSGEESSNGRLTLQLLDPDGEIVASQSVESNAIAHNQPINLVFPPQAESAGKDYTLLISGSGSNNVTIWGYDLDLLEQGSLTVAGPESSAQELRFVTRYQLLTTGAISQLLSFVRRDIILILLSLAFMLLPGCLILVGMRRLLPIWDPAAWWGMALALGLALWSLTWLWLSVLGISWRSWSLWVTLILGWSITIGLYLYQRRHSRPAPPTGFPDDRQTDLDGTLLDQSKSQARVRFTTERISWQHAVLLLILLAGMVVRFLAIRDIAFPPWVDSTRHALITAVMAQSGQWLQDYEPFLAINRFPYHAGFHTLSASLYQMTGIELPRLLLTLGQLINGLVPLTAYSGAYLATRRRNIGLIAAFFIALPFFFPAYYATWGRMTQLAAMLILPLTLALTWQIIRGGTGWRRGWWLLGILVGGLFLIHFRVFLLYLVFAALVWVFSLGRHSRWLLAAASLTVLLVSPRILYHLRDSEAGSLSSLIPGYNDFPIAYVNTGWERIFIYVAIAAVLLGVIGVLRRRRWASLLLILAIWVGLVALVLSGDRLGLPELKLINTNSAYISLFLPLSWIVAVALSHIWRWFNRRAPAARVIFSLVLGGIFCALMLFGIRQQITILNPQTILAESPDRTALAWMQENVPGSAKVAVNSWLWLGNTWSGADGGAWLVPLTGIGSTTPPPDYIYNRAGAQEVNYFNKAASAMEDWSDPSAAEFLRDQGVTHIYVGVKGGFFDPALLARNQELEQIYGLNGAFVFAVLPVAG